MSKKIILIIIVIIIIGGLGYWIYQSTKKILPPAPTPENKVTFDPLNTTYKIEGEEFALVNGKAEKEIVPDSASKTEVVVWSKPAVGDLNNDGVNDAALILTYTGGGSGNFYYVAAAFKNLEDGKAIGTNAILLGDRIALEDISIETGVITVNYADRRKDEPMTTLPSIGITKQFALEDTILKNITSEEIKKEQTCEILGGTVKTSLCCASASDFPNLCLIGACGCSPTNSHQVKVCDCGEEKCWDGENCIMNSAEETPLLSKNFSYPYPLSWQENSINFDLTGVSLGQISAPSRLKNTSGGYYKEGEKVYALTIILKIKSTKTSTSCVLMNFRREINEMGDMASPNNEQFYFPDTGGCMPIKDVTYTQGVIFVVPESEKLFTFSTGGQSKIFFIAQVLKNDELRIEKVYSNEKG